MIGCQSGKGRERDEGKGEAYYHCLPVQSSGTEPYCTSERKRKPISGQLFQSRKLGECEANSGKSEKRSHRDPILVEQSRRGSHSGEDELKVV